MKDANGDRELGAYSVTLAVYENLSFESEMRWDPDALSLWGNNTAPVIEASDTAYSNGYLGLQVWNSSMLFQNIIVHDLNEGFP